MEASQVPGAVVLHLLSKVGTWLGSTVALTKAPLAACCRRRSKSLENLRFLCFHLEDIGNKEENFGVLLLSASVCCVSVARHRMGKRRRKCLEGKGKTMYETLGRKTLCVFKPIKLVVSKF